MNSETKQRGKNERDALRKFFNEGLPERPISAYMFSESSSIVIYGDNCLGDGPICLISPEHVLLDDRGQIWAATIKSFARRQKLPLKIVDDIGDLAGEHYRIIFQPFRFPKKVDDSGLIGNTTLIVLSEDTETDEGETNEDWYVVRPSMSNLSMATLEEYQRIMMSPFNRRGRTTISMGPTDIN